MDPATAVSVTNVKKSYRLYHERNQYLKSALMRRRRTRFDEFWALKDVSFDVSKGEAFGIVGANGSGKSTLLKCLAGILTPDSGTIKLAGRAVALLELGAGFHPDLTGRENIYLNGAILGMSFREIEKKLDTIVEFAGIGRFIDSPVKNYSSGMTVRLGFSIAINVDPEILIIDEVLAVGDLLFQEKCIERILDLRAEGKTIILVSHGLTEVSQICDRALWLSGGEVVEINQSQKIIDRYSYDAHSGNVRLPANSSARWGSGEVTFTDVQLLDRYAAHTSTFESNGDLFLRIWLHSEVEMPGLSVGVRISDLNGNEIWRSSTHRMGFEIVPFVGEFVFQLNVSELGLLEGTYDFTLCVTDPTETHVFEQWDKAARFDVRQSHHVEQGTVSLLKHGTRFSLLD